MVVAANAGGAWSPIGDVTTTMLWTGGDITAGRARPLSRPLFALENVEIFEKLTYLESTPSM